MARGFFGAEAGGSADVEFGELLFGVGFAGGEGSDEGAEKTERDTDDAGIFEGEDGI